MGIEDNSFAGFKLFVDTQHVLQLSSTNKTLDGITIYNLLGQHILSNKLTSTKASIDLSVLNGKITNNTHVIEANTLANGIYIIPDILNSGDFIIVIANAEGYNVSSSITFTATYDTELLLSGNANDATITVSEWNP